MTSSQLSMIECFYSNLRKPSPIQPVSGADCWHGPWVRPNLSSELKSTVGITFYVKFQRSRTRSTLISHAVCLEIHVWKFQASVTIETSQASCKRLLSRAIHYHVVESCRLTMVSQRTVHVITFPIQYKLLSHSAFLRFSQLTCQHDQQQT
jgi:hypothetical protein